jgi:hypothetical protein
MRPWGNLPKKLGQKSLPAPCSGSKNEPQLIQKSVRAGHAANGWDGSPATGSEQYLF